MTNTDVPVFPFSGFKTPNRKSDGPNVEETVISTLVWMVDL